jgi:iron complex outermembrane receptor protein
VVNQSPASPHVRQGRVLTSATPLDANHNPSDAKLDQTRFHLVGGYDRKLGDADWSTLLSVSRTNGDIVRGFLGDLDAEEENAAGFRQDLTLTDLYFDTHVALRPASTLQVVAGADYLYGKGDVHGANFDYFVNLDGSGAPDSHSVPVQEFPSTRDERNFAGLYAQAEWKPAPRWNLQLGVRLNSTHEAREGEVGEGAAGESEPETRATRSVTRGSGTAGLSYLLWDGAPDALWIYADARSAFKPAAIDFGPEGEGDILKPEHGTSYEAGLKGRHLGGRLTWDFSVFQMDLTNVVTSNLVDGLPELVNTGKEQFKGYELEAAYRPHTDLAFNAAYSHHEPKFKDFVMLFDGVPTQLEGKQFEMSPEELGALGVLYAPATGFNASATWNFVGERFLNKRNTALAKEFSTWNAGVGYRFSRYEVRLDGTNLSDARDPIAESELGDAQYYRVPARAYRLTLRAGF